VAVRRNPSLDTIRSVLDATDRVVVPVANMICMFANGACECAKKKTCCESVRLTAQAICAHVKLNAE